MQNRKLSKTVRITQDVVNIVESFQGDNFTEKFENLVRVSFLEQRSLAKQLQQMRKEKAQLAQEISDLQSVKQVYYRVRKSLNIAFEHLLTVETDCRAMAGTVSRIAEQSIGGDAHEKD